MIIFNIFVGMLIDFWKIKKVLCIYKTENGPPESVAEVQKAVEEEEKEKKEENTEEKTTPTWKNKLQNMHKYLVKGTVLSSEYTPVNFKIKRPALLTIKIRNQVDIKVFLVGSLKNQK